MDKDRLFDAEGMSRPRFLSVMGAAGVSLAGYAFAANAAPDAELTTVKEIKHGEDVFAYISRVKGGFDQTLYQNVIGAANAFKEGDLTIGVGADDETTRENARALLANTRIKDLYEHPLLEDNLQRLLWLTIDQAQYAKVKDWTMGQLKEFLLTESEAEIKGIMYGLTSDTIGRKRGIDLCATGIHRERTRILTEDDYVGQQGARPRVEHGNPVVARRADNCFPAGEHVIRRLVLHVKRVRHQSVRNRHHAHAVANLVHDPDFVIVPGIDGDGFKADGDFRNQKRVVRLRDIKNREPCIRGIDGKEACAVGRKADGPGLFAFEVDVSILRHDQGGKDGQDMEAPASGQLCGFAGPKRSMPTWAFNRVGPPKADETSALRSRGRASVKPFFRHAPFQPGFVHVGGLLA